jgi:hypothetical protein
MESVSGKKAARHLADYFFFNAYVLTVLHYINLNHPESERVDFVVDRKEGVFEKLKQFYDTFEKWTRAYRSPCLAKYLGELIPAGKGAFQSKPPTYCAGTHLVTTLGYSRAETQCAPQ